MKEFEKRFRQPENMETILLDLGFMKDDSYHMDDLIFEPNSWVPGTGLRPGYFVIRIRLVEGKDPVAEMKKMLDTNLWDETQLMIDSPENALHLFSALATPRRIITKQREVWTNDKLIICLDDVKDLGRFIEVEGNEPDVNDFVEKVGLSDPQPGYGTQLYFLERDGKIRFDINEMHDIVKRFK